MCFWRSELYASDSGERGRLGSLKAVSALCFQDPLFLVTIGPFAEENPIHKGC
jgi:hypothetical protein